jgi:pimeloyl-ACP methyl ester carboxylesterase
MAVLAHTIDGDGEPLLLLNGGLMTMLAWEPIASTLAARYRVIRCDFRGQLMSLALGPAPATLSGHAADLAALLDHLGAAPAHVVGVSFGALAGLQFAAEYPDRLRSLVAANATDRIEADDRLAGADARAAVRVAAAGGDGRPVFDLVAAETFSPAWLDANRTAVEMRRAQFTALPASWYSGLDALLQALEHLDLRPHLGRITAPTLIVGTGLDRVFPVERSRALASAIPGATLGVIPGASHGFVGEDPMGFVDAVLPFLKAHEGNPS